MADPRDQTYGTLKQIAPPKASMPVKVPTMSGGRHGGKLANLGKYAHPPKGKR